jgi:hypothetical protein
VTQHLPKLPTIDRVKIQAEVLVPILHRLEAALGRERALELLRAAVGDMVRANAAEFVRAAGADRAVPVMWRGISDKRTWEAMHPITVEERRVDATAAEFDVVDCQYAAFFHELDEPDLGFLLVCSADFDMLSDLPQITLERTQTRMQGATHCDFRYRLADEAGRSPE